MTLVAAGCPTTFWDRTLVKSSERSDAGLLLRLGCLGLSAGPSLLGTDAVGFFTRVRRFSSGRFGSFIRVRQQRSNCIKGRLALAKTALPGLAHSVLVACTERRSM